MQVIRKVKGGKARVRVQAAIEPPMHLGGFLKFEKKLKFRGIFRGSLDPDYCMGQTLWVRGNEELDSLKLSQIQILGQQ